MLLVYNISIVEFIQWLGLIGIMNIKERCIYYRRFAFLVLLLAGCQTKNAEEKKADEFGRKSESYVSTLMVQYVAPSERYEGTVPPPPIGWSYLTVGATYKGDSLRILVDTVRELVSLSEMADAPVDSASIASLVKGNSFLTLNEEALKEAYVIKPSASIDSFRSHGKEYILEYYFDDKGYQKKPLDSAEQAALIDALSDWGMLIWQDDMMGLFRVKEPHSTL